MNRSRGTREFKTGAQGQGFWQNHDSSAYLDANEAQAALSANAKPSFTTVALRLPESLLAEIKIEADKRAMPFQLLIRIWLEEALEQSRQA